MNSDSLAANRQGRGSKVGVMSFLQLRMPVYQVFLRARRTSRLFQCLMVQDFVHRLFKLTQRLRPSLDLASSDQSVHRVFHPRSPTCFPPKPSFCRGAFSGFVLDAWGVCKVPCVLPLPTNRIIVTKYSGWSDHVGWIGPSKPKYRQSEPGDSSVPWGTL